MDDHIDAFGEQRQIGKERVAHLLGVVAVDKAAGLPGLLQHLTVFKACMERQLAVQERRGHGKQAVSNESSYLPRGVGTYIPVALVNAPRFDFGGGKLVVSLVGVIYGFDRRGGLRLHKMLHQCPFLSKCNLLFRSKLHEFF